MEQLNSMPIKEYLEHEALSYIQIRDGWKEHTRQWEVYNLVVRQITKELEHLELLDERAKQQATTVDEYLKGFEAGRADAYDEIYAAATVDVEQLAEELSQEYAKEWYEDETIESMLMGDAARINYKNGVIAGYQQGVKQSWTDEDMLAAYSDNRINNSRFKEWLEEYKRSK